MSKKFRKNLNTKVYKVCKKGKHSSEKLKSWFSKRIKTGRKLKIVKRSKLKPKILTLVEKN